MSNLNLHAKYHGNRRRMKARAFYDIHRYNPNIIIHKKCGVYAEICDSTPIPTIIGDSIFSNPNVLNGPEMKLITSPKDIDLIFQENIGNK